LILMRHADAVPATIGGQDFERELSKNGREQARQAARQLAAEAPAIGRILYSPAQRTAETARIVAAALGLPDAALMADRSLYAASPATIRAAIADAHGGVNTLLVVGHNPGVSELAGELSGRPGHLPTAGFQRCALDGGDWQQLLR
jgi:phosphohistidine phosphatase